MKFSKRIFNVCANGIVAPTRATKGESEKRGEDKEEQCERGEQRHELLVQTVEEWERQK